MAITVEEAKSKYCWVAMSADCRKHCDVDNCMAWTWYNDAKTLGYCDKGD